MIEIPLPLAVTVPPVDGVDPVALPAPDDVLFFAAGVVALVPGAGPRPPPPDAARAALGTDMMVLKESTARAHAIVRRLAVKAIRSYVGVTPTG